MTLHQSHSLQWSAFKGTTTKNNETLTYVFNEITTIYLWLRTSSISWLLIKVDGNPGDLRAAVSSKQIWRNTTITPVALKIHPHTPVVRGVYFSKKMIKFFYKIIPPYPLSFILLTSYTSRIPTHHPSCLNNFFTINYIIKSCSGTSLSLPGDSRMISGFSSINYPIPSQSPRNTPLIWIRNWLFLFRFFLVIISITL